MIRSLILSTIALAACSTTAPDGTVSVHADPGGSVASRMLQIAEINRAGTPYRIAGHCVSTCTMLLGLDDVCVEPGATFEFHGPYKAHGIPGLLVIPEALEEDTRRLWSHQMAPHYPEPIRQVFLDDWAKTFWDSVTLTGTQLYEMAPDEVEICA